MFPTGRASIFQTGYTNQPTANSSVKTYNKNVSFNNMNSSRSHYYNSSFFSSSYPRNSDFNTSTGFLNSVQNNVSKLVTENLRFSAPKRLPKSATISSKNITSSNNIVVEINKKIQPNEDIENEGKNWRMLKLFTGQLKEDELPPDCVCPQNNENKEFPFPECHTEDSIRSFPFLFVISDDEEDEHFEKRMKLTEKKISNTPSPSSGNLNKYVRSFPVVATSSHLNLPSTSNNSISNTSKVFTSTAFTRPLELNTNLIKPNETTSTNLSPKQRQPDHQQQVLKSQQQQQQQTVVNGKKRFSNKSLLILKSGKRVYPGSKECFQYAENGFCQAGIFCLYEHDKSLEHMQKKVCSRLLRGLCRETNDSCPGGLHSPLLSHQMPICDFYLRLVCSKGKEQCNFLHVRHTPGADPCPEFNRGCCQRGILCDKPHRYYYSLIKQKSSIQQNKEKEIITTTTDESSLNPNSTAASSSPIKLLRWIS